MQKNLLAELADAVIHGDAKVVADMLERDPWMAALHATSCYHVPGGHYTVLGLSLSSSTDSKDVLEAILRYADNSLEEHCYVTNGDGGAFDALSLRVHREQPCETLLNLSRPSIGTLERAMITPIPAGRAHRSVAVKNRALLERRHFLELGIFAVVWSFRQCFVGDHESVFERLAEAWRTASIRF
jgi:hypothetical protein